MKQESIINNELYGVGCIIKCTISDTTKQWTINISNSLFC